MKHHLKYLLPLLVIGLFLCSCQKEELEPEIDIKTTLLSTGWQMENYIFHYSDGTPVAEPDSLVLTMISSDTLEDTRSVYTRRWIVFDEVAALTAFNYNLYYKEKGSSTWKMTRSDLTGQAGTLWGMGADSLAYLNLDTERPIHIDIINANQFILRAAYLVEIPDPFRVGDSATTYHFGDYPTGKLIQIDEVYRSASSSEGPDWFPAWPYWPQE